MTSRASNFSALTYQIRVEKAVRSEGEADKVNDLNRRLCRRENERKEAEMTDGGKKEEELLVLVSLESEKRERDDHGENHLLVHVPTEKEEGESAEDEDSDETRRRRVTTPEIDQRRR